MDEAESLRAESKAYHFDPDNVAPPEVQKRLWAVLKWRDGVVRGVSEKIEAIPGLETLLDNLTDALNACTSWLRSSPRDGLIRVHRCLHCLGSVALGKRVLLSPYPF